MATPSAARQPLNLDPGSPSQSGSQPQHPARQPDSAKCPRILSSHVESPPASSAALRKHPTFQQRPRGAYPCLLSLHLPASPCPCLSSNLPCSLTLGALGVPACSPRNPSSVSRAATPTCPHPLVLLCHLRVAVCNQFVYFIRGSPARMEALPRKVFPSTFTTVSPAPKSAPGTVIKSLKCDISMAASLLGTESIKSSTIFVEGRNELV